jgi:hypothetical protein
LNACIHAEEVYTELRRAKAVSAAELDRCEKRLGFNLSERGLLEHPTMSRYITCVMYDWMHIYVV